MKNRSAAIAARPLVYYKEYRPICGGSVLAAILFCQLEYWFGKNAGESFYKFLEPVPSSRAYTHGDSWTEELGYSGKEFRKAFDKIGIAYKSAAEFRSMGEDRFLRQDGFEAPFCSYVDRVSGQTFYFRNHKLVDSLLLQVTNGQFSCNLPMGSYSEPRINDLESPVTAHRADAVNDHRALPEMTFGHLRNCPSGISLKGRQETTHETTAEGVGLSDTGPDILRQSAGQKVRSARDRKRDRVWLKLAEMCGIDPKGSTDGQQISITRTVRKLREIMPAEVTERDLLHYLAAVAEKWAEDWRSKKRDQWMYPGYAVEIFGALKAEVES